MHEHHTWVTTEIERNTGTFFRIGGDIRNLHRSYNVENGHMLLQHIVINIEHMFGLEDKLDRKHASPWPLISTPMLRYRRCLSLFVHGSSITSWRTSSSCQERPKSWPRDRQATATSACREVDSALILSQHSGRTAKEFRTRTTEV